MKASDHSVYIVAALRTPIGSFGGSLSSLSCTELGSVVVEAAMKKSTIPVSRVDELVFGNVLQAGVGQNPARQVAMGAGLPKSVPCTTVNKVCASGMKATSLAAMMVSSGTHDVVVVGGMESMSKVPYYSSGTRFGSRFGHQELVDGIVKDGLTDVYNNYVMGNAAELCAKEHGFTREQQDDFAIQSYERSQAAAKNGSFDDEIVPVNVTVRGKTIVVDKDEEAQQVLNHDKVRSMKPAFIKDGSVTAPNSSTLSDGAACLVLCSEKIVKELGLKPLAVITGWADAAKEPERFTEAPSLAIPKALKHAGVTLDDIHLFEINEAFAVVALANLKLLGLSSDNVNVNGGAVSLGHPLGCSGARIIVTLVHALAKRGKKNGCAGICNGGSFY